jgi:acyl-CoA synthetase (AMP-forming)/AMP-acid ligase II
MPYLTEKLAADHYRHSLAALMETTCPAAVITYPQFVSEVEKAASSSSTLHSILVTEQISPANAIISENLPGLRQDPQDIVLLQHSSGTTGLQKGVALSHRAVINQVESYARAIQLTETDVVISWLPLYHDMGLIAGFILPIIRCIPLVLMSPFEWVRAPYKLLQAVSQYKGTLTWLPNFAYNFCAQKIRDRDLTGVDLSTWRAVINCSEPIHASSHQQFIERFTPYGFNPRSIATSYAMAENVFAVTQGGIGATVATDPIDRRKFVTEQVAEPASPIDQALLMVSSGRPIEGTHVRIVDPTGTELPERTIGEIAIQSDCMLTGYFNRPDLTQIAFRENWYLTGDLGYLAEGELYVTGRKKDLIIVGGKNIYPQDIERLAGEVSGVHPGRMVAVGVYSETAGTEEVVILAEADTEDKFERQNIADLIRSRVNQGSDVALRNIEILDRGWLIKTSSGKIARNANREKYLEEFRKSV